MANPRNNCNFVGRIPDTDKIRYEYHAANGDKRAWMTGSISVRRAFKSKDEQYYPEDLLPFSVFGPTADYMNSYVKKGDTVVMTGEFRADRVQTEEGTRTFYKIMVDSVTKVGSSNDSEIANNNKSAAKKPSESVTDEDNPFLDN